MCNNNTLCRLYFETNRYDIGPLQSVDRTGRGVDCGKSVHNPDGGYVWPKKLFNYIVDGVCCGPHRSSILFVFQSNRLWFDSFGIYTVIISRICRFYRLCGHHTIVTCKWSHFEKKNSESINITNTVKFGLNLSQVCRVENLPTKVNFLVWPSTVCVSLISFQFLCWQIRTIGMAICVFGLNCTSFACAKLFPILIEKIGMHGCMIIFAVNCVIGSIFMFFILNETRGKPMDTLQSENNRTVSP